MAFESSRNISKQGLIELANYESMSLKPYLDSGGVKTVGIGSTVSDIKDLPSWPWTKEISPQEAVSIYQDHIDVYVMAVDRKIKREIPQNKFDALVSLCYNIGVGGFSGSTAARLVNEGANDEDVCNAIKRWNRDNGAVVKGLVNRRAKECELYTTGKYNYTDSVQFIDVTSTTHRPIYTGKMIKIVDFIQDV